MNGTGLQTLLLGIITVLLTVITAGGAVAYNSLETQIDKVSTRQQIILSDITDYQINDRSLGVGMQYQLNAIERRLDAAEQQLRELK